MMKLLNLACGAKVSSAGNWTNIDFYSPVADVLEMNILDGLKFADNTFDVVYSAQFVEHLTLDQAASVLSEIHRVLKPGGIIRLVTPDLEEFARSYLTLLERLNHQRQSDDEAKYDWLRLELFDQIVRDHSGGEAHAFMAGCDETMGRYLTERIGYTFATLGNDERPGRRRSLGEWLPKLKKVPKKLRMRLVELFSSESARIGRFRTCGEVHRYVHDVFSLSRLLGAAGFSALKRQDPHTSDIPGWADYELDVIRGMVDGPLSLYMEARK